MGIFDKVKGQIVAMEQILLGPRAGSGAEIAKCISYLGQLLKQLPPDHPARPFLAEARNVLDFYGRNLDMIPRAAEKQPLIDVIKKQKTEAIRQLNEAVKRF
ncbi:hypothetical protein J4439_07930 [Candidatus Woesearchaeota archaeon]|nr:hypothetical protein [Candidatus Woesearchaeota archaeon]